MIASKQSCRPEQLSARASPGIAHSAKATNSAAPTVTAGPAGAAMRGGAPVNTTGTTTAPAAIATTTTKNSDPRTGA